ncbi:MAG TPA: hypothetical protein VN903_07360, partial [Polyangia bacterium]|nr:hypothetical protein [Polyangia bacterium]
MPRVCLVASLGLFAVLLSAAPARAGGRYVPRPPTADEIRVAEARARWEKQGLAAASEMIAALCGTNEPLHDAAAEALVRLGPTAMPHLYRAARDANCRVESAMAAIVCGLPNEWEREPQRKAWDGALSELLKTAGVREEKDASLGLRVLELVAERGSRGDCAMRDTVSARAIPTLAARLRANDWSTPVVLRIVMAMGPGAAPLAPDLIPLLPKDSLGVTNALGAIGPKAAPAVPALRAMIRGGGDGRLYAIAALGGIGAPAGPAVADFAPIVKQALGDLCAAKPKRSAGDVIVGTIAPAVARIGGPVIAPLFPDLVAAYRRERACEALGGWDWNLLIAAAGGAGSGVAPTLASVALDPDEPLRIRETAVASLDKVGPPPAARAQLEVVRAALARKQAVFRRDDTSEPQVKAPRRPGSDRTPYTFTLCRREAGLPALSEPVPSATEAKMLDASGRYASDNVHWNFAYCIADRLCGPDVATYRATIAACCKGYGGDRPWFCE